MPTNPPANPLLGAVYVDQSTNIAWVWTGTYWLQAHGGAQNYNAQVTPTTSIVPGFFADPSPDTWIPHVGATAPLNPGCGQIWVNTSVVPYSASIWDCITATFIPLGGTPGGDTNSIVATVAPAIRVSGDPLQAGDLWINPTTNAIAFWNGAAWSQISTPDTHSILSAAQPATRANGDALLAGDLWTDPNAGNIYFFDGAAWQPIQAVDADHQLSAVAPTTRPNGDPLAVADLWTNTTSNTLFYFDGVAWVRYNDTHSIESAVAPAIRPSGDALQGGDQWFDPVNNLLYVYDSTASGWVLVTTNDTHSILAAGVAPVIRPGGSPLLDGDMWFDTTVIERRLHVYNTATLTWTEVRADDLHSFVGAGAPVLVVRPDGSALEMGDMYVDDTSQQGYYWDGATWKLFGADTHAFLGAGDPTVTNPTTLRPNGTALQDGDIYIDTVSQQGYYYNTATAAWVLFGSDTHSFTGAGDPIVANPVATRPNGTALVAGDQYLDTANGLLYSWNGVAWVLISGDSHSYTGAGDPVVANPVTTRPDGTALVAGDQYLDTVSGLLYGWNGAAWVVFSNDTHSFVAAGAPVLATRPDLSPLQTGDIYIDNVSEQGYYWDGAAWVLFGSDTHSFTGAGDPVVTNPVVTRPNGTVLVTGDQYVDTVTNNLYFWDGAQWEIISNDTHAFVGTDTALQTTRPDGTPLQTGDLFIDTNNNNHLYYYNAGIWTSVSDDTNSQITAGPTGPLTRTDGTLLQDGDQWVDRADGYKLYAWDSTVNAPFGDWVLVSAPDTHSYVSGVELTTRPDGSALQNGDQLYLTTTDPWTLKYWNAGLGIWVGEVHQDLLYRTVNPVNGVDTAVYGTVWHNTGTLDSWEFVESPAGGGLWKPLVQEATIQFATVAPTTQGNGLPLVDGDIYYNPTTALAYIYQLGTTTWLPFGNDTHSFPQATAPVIRPNGSALALGDKWVDTDYAPAIEYYYDGAAFQPMGDVSTVAALPAAGDYANQLLVNSTNNRMYRYDVTAGPAWVQVM